MNYLDQIIIFVFLLMFILAAIKVYKNACLTKKGLGCAGCRLAPTCQKPQKLKEINKL